MKRRFFLGISALTAALFAPIVSQACADQHIPTISEKPRLQATVLPGGYLRVVASVDDLESFFDIYQTELWADWKTHADDNARKNFRRIREQGLSEVLFCCTCWTTTNAKGDRRYAFLDACEKACQHFHVPFDRSHAPHTLKLTNTHR